MREMDWLYRLPTHERRLENGLTVLVREDHSAPVAAVVTHVRAGYFDEPDHLVGISHVLEHMYFKGTERRGVGEIARETKAAGGYLNAGTIYDRTSYYTVLPSSSLEQALDIQADALQRSAIDDEELRRELLVIMQEAKRKLDNPAALAQETLFETMFDTHRIRRWRIGTEEMLRAFTRDDVWQFYRTHYRASNTILVIAGDVDPAHAFALAERYYGGMAAGEPPRDPPPDEPHRREFRFREITGAITRTHAQWGWRTEGSLHEDTAALDALALVLGQGRASRLYRHVREAGHAAAISAYHYTPTAIGIFGIDAELQPAETRPAFESIADVMRALLDHGVQPHELERAQNMLEARMLRRLETAEGQANLLATWQALGDWRLAGDYLRRVLSLRTDDLDRAARTYLQPDSLTILVYRPGGAAPTTRDPAELHRALFDGRPAAPAEAERPAAVAPAVHRMRRLEPQRVEDGVHMYIAERGGARIMIKPRQTVPLVSIALHCRGGVLAETYRTAGISGLMARTSVKGTRTRTAAQIADESEVLGASIAPGAGADTLEWSISVPARHFAAGLDLLLDVALAPTFPAEAAEREREITLSDIVQIRDDMYQYPLRLALSAAYGGHPYGFDLDVLERAVRSVDMAELPAWHAQRVLGGAPYVLVVGDVADADAAAALIDQRVADALHEPGALDVHPPHWAENSIQRIVELERTQTALVVAFPGPPRNHPDLPPLRVLSAAVAGLGGRLFEELRSRRSLAYAVSAAPMARWLGGSFIAYIGTSPEREEEARAALLAELQRLAVEPLDEDEIDRARRYLIGSWKIRQQTHARQLLDLAHALLIGEGLQELREFEQRIARVDAQSLMDAAARWLVSDRRVEGIVRGSGGGR